MAVTGASLGPIYQRLNSTQQYHPLTADTFGDWSMEAGDRVNVSRDGKTFTSPVHSSTLTWNGKQKVSLKSGGKQERDSIAAVSAQKYASSSPGRGGGIRNGQKLYNYEVNQNHLLYEVMDSAGSMSRMEVSVAGLRHEVYDSTGKYSLLQNTADGLYHEVYDSTGRVSKLQNTASGLYHEVYDQSGSFNTLRRTVEGTYSEIYDSKTGLKTRLNATANKVSVVVGDNGAVKPAVITAAVNSAGSSIYFGADHIRLNGSTLVSDLLTGKATFSKVAAARVVATGFYLEQGSGSDSTQTSLASAIRELQIVESSNGKGYTLQKKNFTDASWKTVGSFETATTLTRTWDSGTVTVLASPQNQRLTMSIQPLRNSDITWSGNRAMASVHADLNGNGAYNDTGRLLVVDASDRYNAGRDSVSISDVDAETHAASDAPSNFTVYAETNTGKTGARKYYLVKNNGYFYVTQGSSAVTSNTIVARISA